MPRFKKLVDQGLVGHIGVSNFTGAGWQDAERAAGMSVLSNQVQFSLAHRAPDRDIVPYAQQRGRVVIAYSPIAQGLLSGRYQDAPPSNFRRMRSDFRPGGRARVSSLILALKQIATHHSATPAQVALAWLVNKPNVVAIPGASTVKQLEDNAAAGDLILDASESARLDSLAPLRSGR